MCFSAEASFAGAAVVAGFGVATFTQIRHKRELVYGALPMAFAVHQFLEGVTWVRLDGREGASLTDWPVHLWVIYAWALLPLWVPLGVWVMEPDERRRRWLMPFVVGGGVMLLYMLTGALDPSIEVRVLTDNLDYVLPYPHAVLLAIPYILLTCVAPVLSSYRWVRIFGIVNVVALSIAALIQAMDFSSIWCTFAALMSWVVLAHFRSERRRERADAGAPEPTPRPVTA